MWACLGASLSACDRGGPQAAEARGAAARSGAVRVAGVREREVRVPSDSGVILAGTFALPTDRNASDDTTSRAGTPRAGWPTALLLSGSGPQDRDGSRAELPGYLPFRDIADSLLGRGVAVLRLDDRGTGASTGRFAGATTYDFARDAEAALRWLRAQEGVDPARIALIGHSEGALVAMLVAARDSQVASLVLLGATARNGRELARWQRATLVQSDAAAWPPSERTSVLARAEAEAERAAAADPWLRTWFEIEPREVARRVSAPVLLLHGAQDRQVPVGEEDALAKAFRAGGARVETRRVPLANHLMLTDPDGDPRGYARLSERHLRADVLQAIAAWMSRRSEN